MGMKWIKSIGMFSYSMIWMADLTNIALRNRTIR